VAGMKDYTVYILSNAYGNVLYVGVTSDLERRVAEHKSGLIPGFTQKYKVTNLVYFEQTPSVEAAIAREKQLKSWRREKKNRLIRNLNPDWVDLSNQREIPHFVRDDAAVR
jgi:putative endonuclease